MFVDTSGLLALAHRDEPNHRDAMDYYEAADRRLIHSYVIAEFVPLATARGLARHRCRDYAEALASSDEVQFVWVGEALHRSAVALLRQRLDKRWSLCDAVSFLLVQQYGENEALTGDRHFAEAGFVRLPAPEGAP